MQSLLGQFYYRIKGKHEDIASESLTYIFKNSVRARRTLNQIIYTNTGLEFSDLSYSTQNVGEKFERPDISGKDEHGKEVLIIEAKFWASLTSNQPNKYLERLSKDSVLIFLVPSLRERAIFEEITIRIKQKYLDYQYEIKNFQIKLFEKNQFILIKNWDNILNVIKSELQQENNQILISDVDQIIGLCNTIDSNSFIPISDEDLSPLIPKKINSYFDIVDKVVEEIIHRIPEASIKGLMKTPHRYGYRRYFRIGNLGLGMNLKFDLWSEYSDTPFWLYLAQIGEGLYWEKSDAFKKLCENIAFAHNHKFVDKNNEIHLSLKPKLYKTEDIVVDDLADQIEKIYNELNLNP